MQNLFLLPTEKPSRLTKINDELFFGKNEREMLSEPSLNIVAQHIYITNSEEIKEGEKGWLLENNSITKNVCEFDCSNGLGGIYSTDKKIILTTDQDLIADGVQSIDDEFLEWFVKNPSCEFVKITKDKIRQDKEFNDISHWNIYEYKISISQEEPKRKIDTCYNFDMEIGCVQDICRCEQEEPKQETLKAAMYILQNSTYGAMGKVCDEEPKQETLTYTEAAKKEERIFNSTMMSKQETLEEAAANLADPNLCKTDNWIAGAIWQSEKMYSEEDIARAFNEGMAYETMGKYIKGEEWVKTHKKEWFEQFKKK